VKETSLFFMQGIPEMTGAIAFCLALAKVPINWARTLMIGAAISALSFAIQSLSFFFGLHTFLILFLIMSYVTKEGRISIVKSFLVTSVAALMLGVIEFSTSSIYLRVTGLDSQDVVANQFLWTMLGMPQAIVITLLAVIVSQIYKPVRKGSK